MSLDDKIVLPFMNALGMPDRVKAIKEKMRALHGRGAKGERGGRASSWCQS